MKMFIHSLNCLLLYWKLKCSFKIKEGKQHHVFYGFKKIDLGVMERGALAALLKNQVQFSTPTRQPAMICNSIPRESDVLFWPSLSIACTWCTEIQSGKTLIHIK